MKTKNPQHGSKAKRGLLGALTARAIGPSSPLPVNPGNVEPLAVPASNPETRTPQLRMAQSVSRQIMLTIGALPPETGGILLGPIGSDDITDFYFDQHARCSAVTYSPDHAALNKMMRDEWMPSGIDMKGFAHAHPGGLDRLSPGDLDYIRRLLLKNPDMAFFAAPIVLPDEFRICPFVVLRDDPERPLRARLVFI